MTLPPLVPGLIRSVHSPDGRRFLLAVQRVNALPWVPGLLGLLVYLFDRLWHWESREGWMIQVVEEAPLKDQLLKWMPPPSTTWWTARFPSRRAAHEELNRLAALIQDGVWPPRRLPEPEL